MATPPRVSNAPRRWLGGQDEVELHVTSLGGDVARIEGSRSWSLEELTIVVAEALDLDRSSFTLCLGTDMLQDAGSKPLALTGEPTVRLNLIQKTPAELGPEQHQRPNFRKSGWTPTDGYDDAYMMKGALGAAACGNEAGKPLGYAIGAVGGALAGPLTGKDWREAASSGEQISGGVVGLIAGVTGGLVGGAVQGVVVGSKTVANEVEVTAHLGRVHEPERDSYRIGDLTSGIAAKGRLARGGDVAGYQFGDFTRGLFTASNSAEVRDGLQVEQMARAALDDHLP